MVIIHCCDMVGIGTPVKSTVQVIVYAWILVTHNHTITVDVVVQHVAIHGLMSPYGV